MGAFFLRSVVLIWTCLLVTQAGAQTYSGELERVADKATRMFDQHRRDSTLHYAQRGLTLLDSERGLGSHQKDAIALAARLHTYAGQAYLWRFDKVSAFDHFKEALSLFGQIRDPDPRLLGYTEWGLGLSHPEYESKRAFFQHAIDQFVTMQDSSALVGLCTDAGILQYRNGELEQMREVLQLGARYVGINTSPAAHARIDFQLGRYYEAIGDDESARYYFEQAHRRTAQLNPHDPVLFNITRDLGALLLRHADYSTALSLFESLITPDTEDKSRHRYFAEADMWLEMGRACTAQKDFGAAEQYLLKASDNNLRAGYGPEHVYTANPNAALAHLYLVSGQTQKARERLDAVARAIDNSVPFEHPDYAIINESAARTSMALGDLEGALDRVTSGFTGLGYAIDDPHNYHRVYRYDLLANLMNLLTDVRSQLYTDRPNTATAADLDAQLALHLTFLDSIQQFEIQPAMRARILATNYHVFERVIERMFEQYRSTGDIQFLVSALDISERSRDQLLREIQLKDRLRQQLEIPAALHDEEVRLQRALTDLEVQLFSTEPGDSTRIRRLQSERRALNVQIADVSRRINRPGTGQGFTPVSGTYNTVRELIEPQTAFLEFFDGETEDFVFGVWQDTLLCIAIPSSVADSITGRLRSVLTTPRTAWLPAASAAYQLLLPIFAMMPPQIDRLVVAPAGDWSYIPFESLVMRADAEPPGLLVHSYRVSYTNAIHTQSVLGHTPVRARRLLAAFAPKYDEIDITPEDTAGTEVFAALVRSGNYSLPGAQAEVSTIGALMDGDLFTDAQASEQLFRSRAPRYRILHLSMHALLEEDNPRFSRLVFAAPDGEDEDGYLFASELSTLDLNAQMAVLSACNTGAGRALRGEGVMSLSRAFQYAGVPSIIHSLWKVPDGATSELMVGFYQHLKEGTDKASALRQAKLDYLDNILAPEHAHPYFWAG
ncbi:MAG: CHAT domain-containing protein, partial [Saprospiraceae bacterium]|nr:CHAT domain-containing protein [Saprospiraceae bacterium]